MIEIIKGDNHIGFKVNADKMGSVRYWIRCLDEIVFHEQLTTGSFYGRLKVDDSVLEVMKQAAKDGKILPYYGASGGCGACSYQFRVLNDRQCLLTVVHRLVNTSLNLPMDYQTVDPETVWNPAPDMPYSFFPYLMPKKELPYPVSGECRATHLICIIDDTEFSNLTAWTNWHDPDALTDRYTYSFDNITLGKGFSMSVRDWKTDTELDINDYDAW